jgi:hypothetical protein
MVSHGDRVRLILRWPVEHEEVGTVHPSFPWDDVPEGYVKVRLEPPMSIDKIIPEEDIVEIVDR